MSKEAIDNFNKPERDLIKLLNTFLSKSMKIFEGSINSIYKLDQERKKLPEKIFQPDDEKRKKDKFYKNNMYLYNRFFKEQDICALNLKSNLIHSLNLFERFRSEVLEITYHTNKEHRAIFFQEWGNIGLELFNKNNNSGEEILRLGFKKPDDLMDHKHMIHGQEFKIQKRVFGLYDFDKEEIFLQESMATFIIAREIRNLLSHRGDKTDKKLFTTIKQGMNGTIFKSEKKFIELVSTNGCEFLENFKEGEKIDIDHKFLLEVFIKISFLSFQIINNILESDSKNHNRDLDMLFSTFINNCICSVMESEMYKGEPVISSQFYSLFTGMIVSAFASKSFKINFDELSDIFRVNLIVLYKKTIENTDACKAIIIDGPPTNDSDFDINSIFRKTIDKNLKKIKDKNIFSIISSYVENDDYKLAKSIQEYKEIVTVKNIKTGKEKRLNINEANLFNKKANWKIVTESILETENLFEWGIIQDKINSSIIISAYINGQKFKDKADFLSLYSK